VPPARAVGEAKVGWGWRRGCRGGVVTSCHVIREVGGTARRQEPPAADSGSVREGAGRRVREEDERTCEFSEGEGGAQVRRKKGHAIPNRVTGQAITPS
jgi:hypothetical protein